MIQEYQLRILPEIAANEQKLKEYLSKEKGLNLRDITATRILKRSIDARQRTIFVNLKVRAYIKEMPQEDEYERTIYNNVEGKPQVIVVGAGPGGLFAALRLVELGLRPIVIERGKDVRERKKDLAQISREHTVDPESNYSFGEGGAGAYSDGKLYTRSKKRGNVDKILNVFCQHGASTSILVDAHPHIGTDKLPRVIENMRNTIIECGGEVHFQTRMDALIIENGEVKGIETNTGTTFLGPVILATGHSARDVYRWLAANNVTIEAKGIAVGVRLEHPAMLIDQIQYHNKNGRGKYLPAAEYSFVTQAEGRGVYSFCMCPGGFIVPAASGPEQVVVNGMSPANRGSRWSNSGMVVEIQPEDLENEELKMRNEELAAKQDEQLMVLNPNLKSSQLSEINSQLLSVLHFQEELERQCWLQGGRRQTAPAQRMLDFTRKKLSYDLPESSYSPGLISSPLHFWMPSFINKRLSLGFQQFGRSSHGFLTNEAVMIGVETRTSSPVRIIRDKDNLQHERSKIGCTIEMPALYKDMTASQNLEVQRIQRGIPNKKCITDTLELIGLSNAGKKRVANFSLGMKQRLGLALALINNPDLLILDEPLNGLDPQGIVELREILSHLNKKYGITMLISSHILDELEMIATRYGFIHQGQMSEEITAEKLQEKLKKYISLDVENIGLATITLEQKLHTENFKVMDDHTIYLYDFVNESSLVATTLIQEGVILNKMNISNVSLENYYLSLIKGVESHV